MTTFEALRNKGLDLSQEVSRLVKLLADYQKKHDHFSKKDSERALTFLRQKEKELHFLKKEINFQTKQIRLNYQEKASNAEAGFLATLAGRGRAIQHKANKKRQINDELNRVLKPYEELKLFIDKLLSQISGVKISLQEYTKDSAGTKPLRSTAENSEENQESQISENISTTDPSKKIKYRGNIFSVIEIVSLTERLTRQNPSNPNEISKLNSIIKELNDTLTQVMLNSPPEDLLLGTGKFSLDELTLVAETSTKLGKKQKELAKKNPQLLKWPTFQLLLFEYSDTTDKGKKKELAKQAKSEIKKLISVRQKQLKKSLDPQEQVIIKDELEELNRFLNAADRILT